MSSNLHSPTETTGRTFGPPSIFAELPKEGQQQLKQSAVRQRYSDGAPIHDRGNRADSFCLIERGQVKLGHLNSDGEMQTLLILGPGDSFGELACLAGFARVVDAQAMGEAEILRISQTALNTMLESSPEFAHSLVRSLAVQLQTSLDMLIVFRKMPAGKRIAHALLAMAEGRGPPAVLSVRHQDLAELVGASRMTVATNLAELETLGLVTRRYGKIIVPDTPALRRWMRA